MRATRIGARAAIRAGVVVLSVVMLIVAADLALTAGHTARGAVTAGRDVSNLDDRELADELAALQAQAAKPVRVRTSSGQATIYPADLGLSFDAAATAQRLREQPRNPLSRLAALFGHHHDVAPVVRVDATRFDAALDARRGVLERAAVEGGVHYDGVTPIADLPAGGLRIDRAAARDELQRRWLDGEVVDLPMTPFSPTVSATVVRATVAGPASAAVAADLTVRGAGGVSVRLTPAELGPLLTFVPDGKGGLVARTDRNRGRTALSRLVATETRPVNATFRVGSGAPQVVAARDGAAIDWEKTFAAIDAAVTTTDRTIETAYRVRRPALSTAQARALGVREVVSEFTTSGFSAASGENIRLVAAEVDGALILPGKRFSLNGYTGPRGTAQGYVDSTIIDHGRAATAVGGGISQFATTLYNAAYFAGLTDIDHTEHAYYISRYPEAREATVFEGAIDLVIGNDTRSGVYIETSWSSGSVTVRMWSTKTVDVQSITGTRSAYTTPEVRRIPKGDDCIASSGSRGFTASNTRVITDAATGAEISRHTRTVRYAPEPIVRCV